MVVNGCHAGGISVHLKALKDLVPKDLWEPLKEKNNKLVNGEDLTGDEIKEGVKEIEKLREWVKANMPKVEWRIDGIEYCCGEVAEKTIVIIDTNTNPKTRVEIYRVGNGYWEERSTVWDDGQSRTFTQ